MNDIQKLVRKNVLGLKPYSSARDEFKGNGAIFLDANENAFGSPAGKPFNRYPDPLQWKLKQRIAMYKNVSEENIFIGNGSDEPIDLLLRIFCNPGKDNIILNPPTYGMYEVVAGMNDVETRKCPLTDDYQLNIRALGSMISDNTKIIFTCSPNNPTGNAMNTDDIEHLLKSFDGLVVVDEAYIDFSNQQSMLNNLLLFPNLVVLQTFSKAWGMAGLRVGMAYASKEIILLMNKVKFPYNVNEYSQQVALTALDNREQVDGWIKEIKGQRAWLINELQSIPVVKHIFPTDANFVLVKVADAKSIYQYLIEKNIVVRDRSTTPKCENCVRITIGTPVENQTLISALKNYV